MTMAKIAGSLVVVFLLCGCVPFWTYDTLKQAHDNVLEINKNLQAKIKQAHSQALVASKRSEELANTNRILEQRLDRVKEKSEQIEADLAALREKRRAEVGRLELAGGAKGKVFVTEAGAIGMEGEVLFPPGKHTLKPEAKKILAEIAKKILLNPRYKDCFFRIDGHTDNQPIRRSKYDSNWHLSAMRALSVLEELKKNGVPENRMFIAGFGEFKPRVDNLPGKRGHKKNRRCEITIVESKR